MERPRHVLNGARIFRTDEQRVCRGRVGEWLPESARRKHAIVEIALVNQQQIDVSGEREVLKAIVEHMDADAEIAFGTLTAREAIGADEDGNRWQQPREHQRFVTGCREIGNDVVAV
jgi:hypothetical protein